ncbi:MAG TPA: TolC family protein [Methylomirabilota bacterium]|nr:TolC family protein [Methylomirabilota bacterium]
MRRPLQVLGTCGVLWGLAGTGLAAAQPASPLTVDELVARAIRDNPELAAVRAEAEAAEGRLVQAGLRPNPMLELGGQRSVTGPDSNVGAGVTIPLDLAGRKAGRVGVAEREVDLKRAQITDRERRLRAEIRSKAGELLAARRDLDVADELLDVNRHALQLLGARVQRGAAPPLEERLLTVEVNRLESTRQILQSRLEVAALQLRTLAGWPSDAPLVLAGTLSPALPVLEREGAVQHALAVRPDLAVARADLAMARAKIAKEQADARWDASFNVGYQRQAMGFDGLSGITARGGTRPIEDVFHFLGGGLSITLPVRNRNEGNIAAAAAEARAAERRMELATLTVRQEVEAAFTQHAAAGRALEIYERGVRQVARENLDVVRRTQELGRTSLLDLIAEQRRYIDVETGYTQSLLAAYAAAVEIERAVGAPSR